MFIAGGLLFLLLAVGSTKCRSSAVKDIEAVENLSHEYTAEKTQMKRGEQSTLCFRIAVLSGIVTPEKVSNYTHCKAIKIRGQGILDVEDGALTSLENVERLEINFNHLETIRRGMWHGLQKLTDLNLYENHIVKVEAHAFAEIPELSHLTLSGNEISEIRPDMWEEDNKLYSLSLYNNSIRNLSPGVFGKLKHLRTLDISGNLLMDIESGTFEGLGLNNLYIRRNRLTELRADMWQGLDRKMLGILSVENNLIQHIENQCFSSLPQLGSLFLSHNPLGQITIEMFDKTSLRFLYLISTGLTKLNRGLFVDSLSSVEDLRLDDNDLELTPDIFQGLTDLTFLHMKNCNISDIRPEFWNGLESLMFLYLGQNRIESIRSRTFQNLHGVHKLDLEANQIRYLEPQSLSGLRRITNLNLKHNDLSTLNQDIFNADDFPDTDGHPFMLNLDLEGNPIICDQALDWMIGQDWLSQWYLSKVTCADHPDMTLQEYLKCYTCGPSS